MLAVLSLLLTGALASNAIPYSDNSVEFTARIPLSNARASSRQEALDHVRSLAAGTKKHGGSKSVTTKLDGPAGAEDYSFLISIGGQKINVIADTGSSDLWVPASTLICLSESGQQIPQANCSFGPNFYNPAKDSTYRPLPYKNNFNITYGDGNFVVGHGALSTVSVGNLHVPHTEFAVAEEAYFSGDEFTDGLIGLANPLLTSIFFGTNPHVDNNNNSAEYLPWFYTAVVERRVAPYFSLVLNRPTLAEEFGSSTIKNLGSITFGGIPKTPVTGTTVTVPNHLFKAEVDGTTSYQPAFYTLQVDSFNFPGSSKINSTSPLTILDSGTTLIYAPNDVAAAYACKFDPPAVLNKAEGVYVVPCDAKIPPFSATIGGKTFTTTSADMIFPYEAPNTCISSVVPGGVGPDNIYILGDRFLVNVVSTFDIRSNDITVTQRQKY